MSAFPLNLARRILQDPRVVGMDVEQSSRLVIHNAILREKPMMHEVFTEFYRLCRELDEKYFFGTGDRVEPGAGVSFIKDVYVDVITSDIMPGPGIDRILDAHNLALASNSVRAFYALNCFHHFHDPSRFFSEAERVLIPGGGCILIEPHYGLVARGLYRHLFTSEGFDTSQIGWKSPATVMSHANQALSYIVFRRDRDEFERLHPNLELVADIPAPNYLRYFLSGGLNFRQLVPTCLSRPIRWLEKLLVPFSQSLALHHIVVLRKKSNGPSH